MTYTIVEGESHLYFQFGQEIDPAVNRIVHQAAATIRSAGLAGIVDLVPGYGSLYVEFDPLRTNATEITSVVGPVPHSDLRRPSDRPSVEIPVHYGGAFGPDLDALAGDSNLDPGQVIDLHCGRTYDVFFMGFTPGFAFMGVVDDRIAKPRLLVPRKSVAAGSVGIAGRQTGVYPVDSPGGWRLIGRTPLRMVDLTGTEPRMVLSPGDTVRFIPISRSEFDWFRASSRGR